MSFPNIPNINPKINITFEDAINLLLTSIAMEEISLSKLIDAETDKILCVLKDCKRPDLNHDKRGRKGYKSDNSLVHDVLKINKSVDNTIKNISKLQMLLQYKLENIKDILPCTSSTTTTTTSSSTTTTTTCTRTTTTRTTSSTTTTHTTTCTTSTCSTTTRNTCCGCGLIGKGKGCVKNRCDKFYNRTAVLDAFVYCSGDVKDRTVRYSVGDDNDRLRMSAVGSNVKMPCPVRCGDMLEINGKGFAERSVKCRPDICDRVDYTLTLRKKGPLNIEFRMVTKSKEHPELNHDSGFVQLKSLASDLCLTIYC